MPTSAPFATHSQQDVGAEGVLRLLLVRSGAIGRAAVDDDVRVLLFKMKQHGVFAQAGWTEAQSANFPATYRGCKVPTKPPVPVMKDSAHRQSPQ